MHMRYSIQQGWAATAVTRQLRAVGGELGEDGLQFADKRLATIRVLLSCVVIVTTALPDDHNVDLSRG